VCCINSSNAGSKFLHLLGLRSDDISLFRHTKSQIKLMFNLIVVN
jgi:hypothetical protein